MERILVDDGSAVEVLIFDALKKMGFAESIMRPTRPVYGFSNQPFKVKGLITLLVTLGQGEHTIIENVKFFFNDQIFKRAFWSTSSIWSLKHLPSFGSGVSAFLEMGSLSQID